MTQFYINVQTEDFELAEQYQHLRRDAGEAGAIVTFVGLVRDLPDAPLQEMFLEHYPGMTEASLQQIAEQAAERWRLQQVRIIHRVGALKPADQIVFVGTTSAHRVEAFAACQFVMDYLKRDAPFWKKETTTQGDHWVEQKAGDLQAADQWSDD